MTQAVVNFLEQIGTGSNATFQTDPRIFDSQISAQAQIYYQYQMYTILNALGAQVTNSSGTTNAVTFSYNQSTNTVTTNINDGPITFAQPPNVTAGQASTISTAIQALNNWSSMQGVINGQQYYQIDGGIDANGNLTGTVVITNSSGAVNAYQGATLNSDGSYTLGAPVTVPMIQNPADPTNTQDLIPATESFNTPPSTTFGLGSLFNAPITTSMDQYMAQGVDQLVRTLRSAGWDPVLNPVGTDPVTILTNAISSATSSIYNLGGILHGAVSAASQAQILGDNINTQSSSIQQVLMVDYIATGNDVLFNQMNQLNQAITLNGTALSYLNSLQDLMNQKDPQQFILQLQDLNNVQINSSPQSSFDQFEQDTYNNALNTISKVNASDPGTLQQYLYGLSGATTVPITQAGAAGNTLSVPQVSALLEQYGNLNGLNLDPNGLTYGDITGDMVHISGAIINNTPLPGINDPVTGPNTTETWQTLMTHIASKNSGTFDLNAAQTAINSYLQSALTNTVLNNDPLSGNVLTTFQTVLQNASASIANAIAPFGTTPLATGAFKDVSNSMDTVYGFSKAKILTNLNFLINQITALSGGSSSQLITTLQQVQTDLNNVADLTTWIQDTQNNNVGQFQNDLSNATVAAQSFNDTQRENLRNVMFIFQEFYQSSSGLLSTLDQLVKKMADALAR